MSRKISFKNTIFAFCEGETEEQYLQCFWKFSKVKIYTHKIWEINLTNIKRQISIIQNCLKNRYGVNNWDIKKYKMKIVYIVDVDTIKEKKDVDLIKHEFNQKWIEIIFSNKNIELFILEHYKYYNKESENYIQEIKKFEPKYEKWKSLITKEIFETIIENNIDLMRKNLKELKKFHERNKRTHIYDMNPYTEIIDLIEYILRISNNN